MDQNTTKKPRFPQIRSDFHMHSYHSGDSDTPMEDQIRAALSLGLSSVCFTEHLDMDWPYQNTPDLAPDLLRHGGIIVREIIVGRAGVDDAEGVLRGVKIKARTLNDGVFRIAKVDGDRAADGGAHLIHQAAGLAVIVALGHLRELRNRDRVEGVPAERAV